MKMASHLSLPPANAIYMSLLSPKPGVVMNSTISCSKRFLTVSDHSSTNHILSSFIYRSKPPSMCRASSPGSPKPEPPTITPGLPMTLSKTKDSVHIFFAVLFWMVLYFWSSAWDGKNDGRSDKGSRF